MKARARDDARALAADAQLDLIVLRMVKAGFPVTVAEGTIALTPPRRGRGAKHAKDLKRPPSRERRSGGVRRAKSARRRTGADGVKRRAAAGDGALSVDPAAASHTHS